MTGHHDLDDENQFRREIAAFLKETGMAASRLGRAAINDSAFVSAVLKAQRSPGLKTAGKLRQFMADYRAAAKRGKARRKTKEGAVA